MPGAAGKGRNQALAVLPFYRNRLWRILPSYLLAVLAAYFLFALPQGSYASDGARRLDLWSHLTLTQTFFLQPYYGTPLNGVLWTGLHRNAVLSAVSVAGPLGPKEAGADPEPDDGGRMAVPGVRLFQNRRHGYVYQSASGLSGCVCIGNAGGHGV